MKFNVAKIASVVAMAVLTIGISNPIAAENGSTGNWPQWRGPSFNGAALGSETPATWGPGKNLKWKVAIPGKGHSTPIVWEDKVFILTAIPEGKSGARNAYGFAVICIDRETGKTLWQQIAQRTAPHEGYHRTYGSFASGSPSTDGERVYAFFGSRGLFAYDMDGAAVWKKDFGVEMRMRNAFGEGTSPLLHGNKLVVHFDDNSNNSFIVALDKNSGEELWRTRRDEISSWATPVAHVGPDRTEVIVSASSHVRSYDIETGKDLWRCAGLGTNVIPMPVIAHGNVIVMSGHRQPALFAIELGRTGDLTGTDAIKWSVERGMPYTPSPLLHGDDMYIVDRRGTVTCIDTRTGRPHYSQQRLPKSYSFKASPTASKDKIYLASEQGDVIVLKPGPKFEVLATVAHDEFFVASPAIAGGDLFLRGSEHLMRVAAD